MFQRILNVISKPLDFNGSKYMIHRRDTNNSCSSPRRTKRFLLLIFFGINSCNFRWQFRLSRLPELHNGTNRSIDLAYHLVKNTCESVCAHFMPTPAKLFPLFQLCQYGRYPSIQACRLYVALFHYIIVTTKPSVL